MSIFVAAYWPFFKTNARRQFNYVDKTKTCPDVTSVFTYDAATDSMLCKDYDANMVYQDTWYMQYDPALGVKEWRDDYPQTNSFLASLFGPVKKEVLSSPILWGNNVVLGQVVTSNPSYSTFSSSPPMFGSGTQKVTFEALLPSLTLANGTVYPNVLQFSYAQTWNGKTTGARYWNAIGVGPIAIAWIGYDASGKAIITQPRMDAQ